MALNDEYTIKIQVDEPDPRWIPILAVNVADPPQYSTKPFKWLRYLVAAVLGAQGDLLNPDTNEPINYDNPPSEMRVLHYQPQSMIRIVDPQALNHFVSESIKSTLSRCGFREDVVRRDGTCVITNLTGGRCVAAHLIPHAKKDTYIEKLSLYRRDSATDQIISSIVDVRNGILLCPNADTFYTARELAVLQSPNFALSMDEVLPPFDQALPEHRFTLQLFHPDIEGHVPSGDIRTPAFSGEGDERWPTDWAPAWLWDFIYGAVGAEKYSTDDWREFTEQIGVGQKLYGPGGAMTAQKQAQEENEKRKEERNKAKEQHDRDRDKRAHDPASNLKAKPLDGFALASVSRSYMCSRPWAQKQFELEEKQLLLKLRSQEEEIIGQSYNKVSDWLPVVMSH